MPYSDCKKANKQNSNKEQTKTKTNLCSPMLWNFLQKQKKPNTHAEIRRVHILDCGPSNAQVLAWLRWTVTLSTKFCNIQTLSRMPGHTWRRKPGKDNSRLTISWHTGLDDYELEKDESLRKFVNSRCLCVCSVTLVLSNSLWPMDCNLSGSSVHGIFQVWMVKLITMPSSRGLSRSRHWTHISCIACGFFTHWAIWEAQNLDIWVLLVMLHSWNSYQISRIRVCYSTSTWSSRVEILVMTRNQPEESIYMSIYLKDKRKRKEASFHQCSSTAIWSPSMGHLTVSGGWVGEWWLWLSRRGLVVYGPEELFFLQERKEPFSGKRPLAFS